MALDAQYPPDSMKVRAPEFIIREFGDYRILAHAGAVGYVVGNVNHGMLTMAINEARRQLEGVLPATNLPPQYVFIMLERLLERPGCLDVRWTPFEFDADFCILGYTATGKYPLPVIFVADFDFDTWVHELRHLIGRQNLAAACRLPDGTKTPYAGLLGHGGKCDLLEKTRPVPCPRQGPCVWLP